jgi:NhaP-type Na+/H+ or K+/H+ antiporter
VRHTVTVAFVLHFHFCLPVVFVEVIVSLTIRYVLASSLHMSGVMAVRPNPAPPADFCLNLQFYDLRTLQVLFCGVTMSHYTQHNLSAEARAATRHIFEAFAYTTNIFLFAYIGFVSSSADVFTPAVIVLAFAAVCAHVIALVPL